MDKTFMKEKKFNKGFDKQQNLNSNDNNDLEENNEIEKAIELAEDFIVDINEQYLGSSGWIEKLIVFQRKKNGDSYVISQIDDADVKIKINEFYIETTNAQTLTAGFQWSEIFVVSVELFGKEYWTTSTIQSQDEDNKICDDYILSKKNKEDLKKYFDGRWRKSLMYREIEKLK